MLSLFPRDALDGIWDLTESVSAGFLNNFFSKQLGVLKRIGKNLCKLFPCFVSCFSLLIVLLAFGIALP